MKAYITSTKAISPQYSFEKELSWQNLLPCKRFMAAIEPNYKNYFPPLKLRRMSRIVKMGITSAIQCLKEAGIEKPGGIITATGWGCLDDTITFLDEIAAKKEQMLSPATFIQSTHNTVGGQIALMLGCREYNSVYVNHTSSFEHGLLDAMMLLNDGSDNILVGGIDELVELDFKLKGKAGYWKVEGQLTDLAESKTKGTIAGEGSVFFLLSGKPDKNTSSQISSVRIESKGNAEDALAKLLKENGIGITDVQVCIAGINGDSGLNRIYRDFLNEHMGNAMHTYYKHLCGQYDTSSAFALFLANEMIKKHTVPDALRLKKKGILQSELKHILIYHYSEPNEHAFILVSKAGL
ncbi:MAG: beta-ketoacyl synthase chain length factor [Bacteroidales bacterium]|jgi:hypothetical protein